MFLVNGQIALSLQSKGSLHAISKGNGVWVPDCLAAVSSIIAPGKMPLPRKGWEGAWGWDKVRRPAFSSKPKLAKAPRCKGWGAMSYFICFQVGRIESFCLLPRRSNHGQAVAHCRQMLKAINRSVLYKFYRDGVAVRRRRFVSPQNDNFFC